MKISNNSIIPIIEELERVYKELIKHFQINTPQPIITIQSKGRKKFTLGWYCDKRWLINKEEIDEINICAENLKENPIETLVHEMVHYTNTINKVEDCNHHGYHNKQFKQTAENYGLNVEKDGRHGWGLTSIGKKLEEILKQIKPNYELFKLYRKENLSISAPTKMKKYRCECTTIRCATELNAICKKCNKPFNLEEKV